MISPLLDFYKGNATSFARTIVSENTPLWRRAGGNLLLSSFIVGGSLLGKKTWNAYPITSFKYEKVLKTVLKVATIALAIGVAFLAYGLTAHHVGPESFFLPFAAQQIALCSIYALNKYSTYNGEEIYKMLSNLDMTRIKVEYGVPLQVFIDLPKINSLIIDQRIQDSVSNEDISVHDNVTDDKKYRRVFLVLAGKLGSLLAQYICYLITQPVSIVPLSKKINAQVAKSFAQGLEARGADQTVIINVIDGKIHLVHKLRFDLLSRVHKGKIEGYVAAKIEYLLPSEEFVNGCENYFAAHALTPQSPFPNCYRREVISKTCKTAAEANTILASY